MHWSDFERAQPRLAGLGVKRLIEPGVVLVGTVRRDGAPRLSPVEPLVMDGDLWLSMMWQSAKARDLLRDPRILVHSVITSRDGGEGEFKIRGTARPEYDPVVQRRYTDMAAASLGWEPAPGRFHLFAVDINDVAFLRYDDSTGDQQVAMWPPGQEFVRHSTSATSVGEPEPVSEFPRRLILGFTGATRGATSDRVRMRVCGTVVARYVCRPPRAWSSSPKPFLSGKAGRG